MSDDEVICRGLVAQYQVLQDQAFKAIYLPYPEAVQVIHAVAQSINQAKEGPLAMFCSLHPPIQSALAAETRLNRRIEALRVIESIRFHASTHEGKLPESLSELTELPISDDPATCKPFEYHLKNETARLSGPAAGIQGPPLDYRLSIRGIRKQVSP